MSSSVGCSGGLAGHPTWESDRARSNPILNPSCILGTHLAVHRSSRGVFPRLYHCFLWRTASERREGCEGCEGLQVE